MTIGTLENVSEKTIVLWIEMILDSTNFRRFFYYVHMLKSFKIPYLKYFGFIVYIYQKLDR